MDLKCYQVDVQNDAHKFNESSFPTSCFANDHLISREETVIKQKKKQQYTRKLGVNWDQEHPLQGEKTKMKTIDVSLSTHSFIPLTRSCKDISVHSDALYLSRAHVLSHSNALFVVESHTPLLASHSSRNEMLSWRACSISGGHKARDS